MMCPTCLAHGTSSGYLPHAPLCPNGIGHLAWDDTYPRLDGGAAPLRATSHVEGVAS